jgi:hypothetical protein
MIACCSGVGLAVGVGCALAAADADADAEASGAVLWAGAVAAGTEAAGAAEAVADTAGLDELEPHAATMSARSATEVARRRRGCIRLQVLRRAHGVRRTR